MQIKSVQLAQHAKTTLDNLFILIGDDPLLLQESRDILKNTFMDRGHERSELVHINTASEWDSVYPKLQSTDLFSSKKILDIRNNGNKVDKKAQQVLAHITANSCADTIIIISIGKLTAAQKKAKWFLALNKFACTVTIWPVSPNELPHWIHSRMQSANLTATQDSIRLLASLTEGNLLAAQQAILKLKMLNTNRTLQPQDIYSVVHNASRYSVFDLSQYALAGDAIKAQNALNQLLETGTEPTLVLWVLSKEVRLLYQLKLAHQHGQNTQTLLKQEWQSRQQLLKSASQRIPISTCITILTLLSKADRCIKGLEVSHLPTLLSQITLGICGITPLEH